MTDSEFIKYGEQKAKLDRDRVKAIASSGDLEFLRTWFYQNHKTKYMSETDDIIQFLNDLK